jgi:hypothetical protein
MERNPHASPAAEVADVPDPAPPQPLQASFRPLKCRVTVADELAFSFYVNTRPRRLITHLVMGLGLVLVLPPGTPHLLLYLFGNDASHIRTYSLMYFGAFGLYRVVQLGVLYSVVLRRWGNKKTQARTFTLQLATDGVITWTANARSEMRWTVVKGLGVTRGYVFLLMSTVSGAAIPRRVFNDDAEWQSFVTAVREGFARGKAVSSGA